QHYPNLHLVGRNGMHKYNNQDHAMMTAMLCVENILADEQLYDLWQVNSDAEYHETSSDEVEKTRGTALRLVPLQANPSAELAPGPSGYQQNKFRTPQSGGAPSKPKPRAKSREPHFHGFAMLSLTVRFRVR